MPKYSSENHDQGFVYLDGQAVFNVIECDTDEGYIIRHKRGKDGHMIVSDNYEIMTERLTGVVTFEPIRIEPL